MALLQFLISLVLGNAFGTVLLPNWKPCLWRICRGSEWRNDWAPSISQGQCVNQNRNAYHLYSYFSSKYECKASIPCLPQTRHRTMCKYGIFLFGLLRCHKASAHSALSVFVYRIEVIPKKRESHCWRHRNGHRKISRKKFIFTVHPLQLVRKTLSCC